MSGYQRWDQPPALGRRGMILAVLIPVLVAMVGFGAVVLNARGSETTGTVIRLPQSEWIPGQGGDDALIQGVLSVDEDRCVYLASDDGRLWPVWPAGYRARLDGAGHVTVYDGGDKVVGRDGDELRAGGGYRPAGAYAGEPCVPTDGAEVAVIQSEVSQVD